MAEAETPPAPSPVKRKSSFPSPKSLVKKVSSLTPSSLSKSASKKAVDTPVEDGPSTIEKAREAERERLVNEAKVAEEKDKLAREEARRIAVAQAEEEKKRRLRDLAALEEAEAEERRRNRKSVNDAMEQERLRLVAEGPDSPRAQAEYTAMRQAQKLEATKAIEGERMRRVSETDQVEETVRVQRRKSQSLAIKASEAERLRRLGKSSGASWLASAAAFLVASVALLLLLVLTFEESLGALPASLPPQAQQLLFSCFPSLEPPPPPPPPSFFGLF
jgi:cobalamin biosynthesis Mg chelatase CobN